MLVSARASLEEVWEVVTRHSGPSDVMLSSCCRDQDLDLIPTTVIEKQTPGHTSDKVRTPLTLVLVFSWRIMNPSPAPSYQAQGPAVTSVRPVLRCSGSV